MLHIATAHFKFPGWIPVQARELRKNISVPYLTWGSLEEIDPSYGQYFDRVLDQPGKHEEKLNRLAAEIVEEAADEDLLMFLDGDAFPIADPVPLIELGLSGAPLMAVRRYENCDEPQPHPCFCVTDVATWRNLPGDWSEGSTWPGPDGEPVTDVGAQLLRQLDLSGVAWAEILRSNRHDLHPVFFGIYGDAIYHHGAGFRKPVSRADLARLDSARASSASARNEIAERNLRQSLEMFERIERDDPGWLGELV
jgi:hypothetical protein